MAFHRARTLGIHFGNHRLQGKLLRDIRDVHGERRGYRLHGDRHRNHGRSPIRRRLGGHQRANVAPPPRHSMVSSTAPSVAPPIAPPPRAPTPLASSAPTTLAPPAPVLALSASTRPRCQLHGDGLCPPPPPSMVASQPWLSLAYSRCRRSSTRHRCRLASRLHTVHTCAVRLHRPSWRGCQHSLLHHHRRQLLPRVSTTRGSASPMGL